MIKITSSVMISESELIFTFIRAPGPGGQNVNKVATAALLRFNVLHSPSLPDEVRERLILLAGNKMTLQGELIIKASRYRTQERNKQDAVNRLQELVKRAATIPKKHKNPEKVILIHGKRNTKAEFTSGISWEDENVNELKENLAGQVSKIACTSPDEIIHELVLRSRFRKLMDTFTRHTTNEAEEDGDITLSRLTNEIDRLREDDAAKEFVNALNALDTALRADYSEQKNRSHSAKKIQSSAAIRIAKKTTDMLQDLQELPPSENRKKTAVKILATYEKQCNRISGFNFFAKAVAVVLAAAIGFLLGAVIGAGIGFLLGAWAGPGAVVTSLLGLLHGAYSGAALGLVAGTAATGITTASLSGYLLFKPNKMTNDVKNVATAGKNMFIRQR